MEEEGELVEVAVSSDGTAVEVVLWMCWLSRCRGRSTGYVPERENMLLVERLGKRIDDADQGRASNVCISFQSFVDHRKWRMARLRGRRACQP